MFKHEAKSVEEDPVLSDLKKSGKKIKELLGINQTHINAAIEEVRKKMKK